MTRFGAALAWVALLFSIVPARASATPPADTRADPIRRSLRDCPLPDALDARFEREGWSDDALVDALRAWRAERPSRFGETVFPDAGVRLVPDFAPMQTLHLVSSGWRADDAQFLAMTTAASHHGDVRAAVLSPSDVERLRARLRARGARMDRITFAEYPLLETIWMRDFGPVPVETPAGPGVVDFGYAIDCTENDAYPTTVARPGDRVWRSDLMIDGGNLMTDGRGACFTTTGLLEATGLDRDALSGALRQWVGCERLVVLEPLARKAIDHVDMFLTPAPDGVLLLAAFDRAEDPANHAVMAANRAILAAAQVPETPWTLVDLPVPAPRASGPSSDPLAWTAIEAPVRTWNNLLPFNGVVLVPDYAGTEGERRDRAWAAIETAFPDRALVPVPSDRVIEQGGAVHCLGRATPPTR